MIVNGSPATVSVNCRVTVLGADSPAGVSVTCTVNELDPTAAAEGVPDKTPARLNDKPGGACPDATDHVYGGLPPLAVKLPL
jgi:hypothetical protein